MAVPTPPPMTHDRAEALDLRGLPERADHVADRVAGSEGVQQLRRLADALDDDRDVPALGVRVRDRERDALAVLVDADDDELAGLALARDAGGLDAEELDVGGEEACFDYLKHDLSNP